MYGWRGRIGLINVANNTVLEPEVARVLPEGVSSHCARIRFRPTIEGLNDMINYVEEASLLLSSEGICDVIAFGCTMGSMIKGPGYDKEIIALIERVAKTPAITITTAVLAALEALSVRRLAVVTPYTKDINEVERRVLTGCGYEVTELISCHESVPPQEFTNEMIGRLPPHVAYSMGRKADNPRAEAVFMSCANLHCLEIIELLEADTGKPVVASNQALAWLALRKIGVKEPIRGYGRLLREH